MAREFGPKGVHVAHAVIDGVIDIPRTKEWQLGEGGKIKPEAVSFSNSCSGRCFGGLLDLGGFCGIVLIRIIDCGFVLAFAYAA